MILILMGLTAIVSSREHQGRFSGQHSNAAEDLAVDYDGPRLGYGLTHIYYSYFEDYAFEF